MKQKLIEDCMERNGFIIDMKKVETLWRFSGKGKLNDESVYQTLSGETKQKPNRTPMVKINVGYSQGLK